MGLLSEEIPPYETLIHEEELPTLNLKLVIDSISTVPLYDRLDIDKGSLSENERKHMELHAEKYNDNICNLINNEKLETLKEDISKFESEYSEIEEFLDLFLKNLYNCSENDELLSRIKRNSTIDDAIQESTVEVPLASEFEPHTPSKDFLQFFLEASDGKHDNLFINESFASHDSSSDISSDEKDEIMEDKIKELSNKLKFCDSSNSKFLEPIINASKHSSFEIISESSCKIPTLKKEEIFLSDSESENDLKKKHLVLDVDKKSNEQLSNQTKKNLKALKKRRERHDSKGERKTSESGEKKPTGSIERHRSHLSIPPIDKDPKINLDKVTTSTATSTKVVVSPRQLSNINENNKKHSNKKKVNLETSSSGDEDWENLAEKNLILRSKTLGQKVLKR